MKIKDLPKENRPRERFLKYGPEALSDAELFAILLKIRVNEKNSISTIFINSTYLVHT